MGYSRTTSMASKYAGSTKQASARHGQQAAHNRERTRADNAEALATPLGSAGQAVQAGAGAKAIMQTQYEARARTLEEEKEGAGKMAAQAVVLAEAVQEKEISRVDKANKAPQLPSPRATRCRHMNQFTRRTQRFQNCPQRQQKEGRRYYICFQDQRTEVTDWPAS